LKSLQHLEHDLSSLYVIRKKYKNLMVQQWALVFQYLKADNPYTRPTHGEEIIVDKPPWYHLSWNFLATSFPDVHDHPHHADAWHIHLP
jgi:hypothetical protein